ncbi:MAG TPA: DUF362 domain-containing protein, partial [Desulfatiglandales bacterium]|nr:DUF362 domain-containing protein [Desulfatiglandales bacterium]
MGKVDDEYMAMKNDFQIVEIAKPDLLNNKVKDALNDFSQLFPEDKSARILLKPNFNSNFNALTGNTTDFRLLAAVIEFLQERGYSNITIAEGTNSGFVREKVSVINRLKADRLAAHYGVEMIDLNTWSQSIDVPLENGVLVQVADLLAATDFVINMPKLKTHFEVGMSVCLKNLIGTCIGRENKKKIHGSLAKNIVHLNEVIKPKLHIVDGLIAMEGNGPSRGTPVNYGKIIIGTNPFQIDHICARLIGFPRGEVKTLVEAKNMNLITDNEYKLWESISLNKYVREFKRPELTPLVAFVIDPRFQKHLIRIRYAPVINTVCSTESVKSIFYALGISHERIRNKDAELSFKLDL